MSTKGLLLALVCAAVAVGASVGSAGAKTTKLKAFKTKSGNIVCVYSPKAGGQKASVVCGIKSGLKPKPPKRGAACKHVDYDHNRIVLFRTGKAKAIPCAGDAGPLALAKQAKVLKPRAHFGKGGFWCISPHPSRMVCTNGPVHGFYMSKRHSEAF